MKTEKDKKIAAFAEKVMVKTYVKTFIKLFQKEFDAIINELVNESLKETDLSKQEKEEVRKELVTSAYANIENAITAVITESGVEKIKKMKKEDLLQQIVTKLQSVELDEEKTLQELQQ
jgi:hypothetical protein